MTTPAPTERIWPAKDEVKSFAETFGLPESTLTRNAKGAAVMCLVLGKPAADLINFVPDIDPNYQFPIRELKYVMVAAQINKAELVWGPHGTGKTTLIEQYCARTNRPVMRVNHTVGTEKADLVGHYVVKSKVLPGHVTTDAKGKETVGQEQIVSETVWEPGPLMIAMRDGFVYLADEYDFALPSVTSVYQAVLEGKPLTTPEAPPEFRVIKPHKNFRFYATGNTNGAGDETGLYQGTQIMNAANYSRFGLTVHIGYMSDKQEAAIIAAQAQVHMDDALKLTKIAGEIRTMFTDGKLSATISPRELINAATLGRMFGKEPDLHQGMELAYANRLGPTDRKAVMEFVQRHAPPVSAKAA